MPFPLAHPAAVMPLRRFCPKWLSLSALVVGSISPDFGYSFGPLKVDEFSHRLLGTFVFCLPTGLIVLWAFYSARTWFVEMLPSKYQAALRPLCNNPPASVFVLVVSLLVGAWTHVLWDAFTHREGWFVLHSAFLQSQVGFILGHRVRVFHCLWYLCSFAGVGWLFLIFDTWMERTTGMPVGSAISARLGRAMVVATAALVLAPIHHLASHWLLFYCAGLLSVLLVLVVALKLIGLEKTAE